jgi:hypothetical protein
VLTIAVEQVAAPEAAAEKVDITMMADVTMAVPVPPGCAAAHALGGALLVR